MQRRDAQDSELGEIQSEKGFRAKKSQSTKGQRLGSLPLQQFEDQIDIDLHGIGA
jgi:hypothetical protein